MSHKSLCNVGSGHETNSNHHQGKECNYTILGPAHVFREEEVNFSFSGCEGPSSPNFRLLSDFAAWRDHASFNPRRGLDS